MTLASGTRLGPYEIVGPLGAGGMGEVYRARDARLSREVAIKILPEAFAADPERLARFQREAQVLASLNHPHIAAIYGLEETDGRRALVLELVEGETLADRIARGPIVVEESLEIAKQIALALEAAHDRGIVHRDLKPANVKLTPEGGVKVLDFGLAKALTGDGSSPDVTSSPTLTAGATQAGVVIGTAAYMSPEQARGKAVNKRADIWAFGAVLYEMLTGRKAFEGETVSDTLAAVLMKEPEWSALPPSTSSSVRRVLKRCLDRDPRTRFHDIADARIEMEIPPEEEPRSVAQSVTDRDRGVRKVWMGAALLLLAAAAGLALFLLRRPPRQGQVVRASILFPPKTQLALDTIQPGPPAISPDGRRIVFVLREPAGFRRLWMRELDWDEARPIEGTDDASYPFWSPDSRTIGFFSQRNLKRVPAAGGPVLTLCDAPAGKGGTWNRHDLILFSPTFNTPIFRVSAAGGAPSPLTKLDFEAQETSHRFPQFLPGGTQFLYLVRRRDQKNLVRVGSLDGGGGSTLLETKDQAVAASGALLFLRDRTLMAQPFDAGKGRLVGQPVALAQKIQTIPGAARAVFTASENGALVYQTGEASPGSRLVWVDRRGNQIAAVGEAAEFSNPVLAPDSTRIAVEIEDGSLGTDDIWILDARTGNRMRVTFDPGNEFGPVWSPDGKRLAYASNRRGPYDLFVKELTGSGQEKIVLKGEDNSKTLSSDSWSSDGRHLLYTVEDQPTGSTEIWTLDLTGEEKPRLLAKSRQRFPLPRFSPDGRWVAFGAADSGPGTNKIFVASFAEPERRWQVAGPGSLAPRWRPDGRELYYLDRELRVTAVEVPERGSAFEWGPPQVLFPMEGFGWAGGGDRFLKEVLETPDAGEPLTLLLGWPALLEKKGAP